MSPPPIDRHVRVLRQDWRRSLAGTDYDRVFEIGQSNRAILGTGPVDHVTFNLSHLDSVQPHFRGSANRVNQGVIHRNCAAQKVNRIVH